MHICTKMHDFLPRISKFSPRTPPCGGRGDPMTTSKIQYRVHEGRLREHYQRCKLHSTPYRRIKCHLGLRQRSFNRTRGLLTSDRTWPRVNWDRGTFQNYILQHHFHSNAVFRLIFQVFFVKYQTYSCGKLSWLPITFWPLVKYRASRCPHTFERSRHSASAIHPRPPTLQPCDLDLLTCLT